MNNKIAAVILKNHHISSVSGRQNKNKRRKQSTMGRKARIRRIRLLTKFIKTKICSPASFLAARTSLDWKRQQGGLLTHQDFLLCSVLDVFTQEKRLILQSKLRARAEPLYSYDDCTVDLKTEASVHATDDKKSRTRNEQH